MKVICTGQWETGYTFATTYVIGSVPYLLRYKSDTGEWDVVKITGASSFSNEGKGHWEKGYTLATTYVISGIPYLLMYNKDSGDWNILKITGASSFAVEDKGKWAKGYTLATTYVIDSIPYLLMYIGATGDWNTSKIKVTHDHKHIYSVKARGQWPKGYTSATTCQLYDQPYLFMYKATTGCWEINSIRKSNQFHPYDVIKAGEISAGFSLFLIYKDNNNNQCLLLYNSANGYWSVNAVSFELVAQETIISHSSKEEKISHPKFSGYIEAFYWKEEDKFLGQWGEFSHEERRDLIRYLGNGGFNTYVYNPKFKRDRSGSNIKASDIESMSDQREWQKTLNVAKNNNIKFVWGISPGWVEKDSFAKIINVMNRLVNFGVNYFLVTFDDVPGASGDYQAHQVILQVELINSIEKEAKLAGKIVGFCPAVYINEHLKKTPLGNKVFEILDKMPPNIPIVWAGESTWNNEIGDNDMPRFKSGRKLWLWDNHMACDQIDRLIIDPPMVREKNLIEKLDGYVICGCFPAYRCIPVLAAFAYILMKGFADFGKRVTGQPIFKDTQEIQTVIKKQANHWFNFLVHAGLIDSSEIGESSIVELLKCCFGLRYEIAEVKKISNNPYLKFYEDGIKGFTPKFIDQKSADYAPQKQNFFKEGVQQTVSSTVPGPTP